MYVQYRNIEMSSIISNAINKCTSVLITRAKLDIVFLNTSRCHGIQVSNICSVVASMVTVRARGL